MTKPSLPYLGGIFDGEGSIFVMRIHQQSRYRKKTGDRWRGANPSHYYVCVSVAMCNAEPVIAEFARRFRGSIKQQRTKNGHIVHHWQAVCKCAHAALTALLPHLRVKRRQAILALRLQRHLSRGKRGQRTSLAALRYRERIRATISGLNLVRGKRATIIQWSKSTYKTSSHVKPGPIPTQEQTDNDGLKAST